MRTESTFLRIACKNEVGIILRFVGIPLRIGGTRSPEYSVSETSLKNYFRGVYGKNVSDYLRDLRMSIAEKLLTETKLPISEIASQIGYTKQGKFAEVFRQQFQMNPLEYRRSKKLKNI